MPEKSKNTFNFWQELKRRKVFRVIAMYAGFAYIIIELTSNLSEPLHLPPWVGTLIVIVLVVGFPVIATLSWFFDITPQGVEKTAAITESLPDKIPPERRQLRVSDVIIGILLIIIVILVYPKIFRKDKFQSIRDEQGRITIAIMPFNNLTTDTSYNIWQKGLQNLIITSLSNSEELSVRNAEPTNIILGRNAQMNFVNIEPSIATGVAAKLKANIVIIGNILRNGPQIRITANLVDSRTEEMYKSFKIDGDSENDFFNIIDSLSFLILNYVEIKSLEHNVPVDYASKTTSSSSAYKLYLQGREYHGKVDYTAALEKYSEALEIDSTFVSPMLYLAHIYRDNGQSDKCISWVYKAFDQINKVPHDIQLEILEMKAMVDKHPESQLLYINEYLEINPYSTQKLYTAGWINYSLERWQEAIEAFEKGIELNENLEGNLKLWVYYYTLLGNAYKNIGDYEKALRTFDDGLEIWPNDFQITRFQAACALSQNDTTSAKEYLSKLNKIARENGMPGMLRLWWNALTYELGNDLSKAEESYRSAIILAPDNDELINAFAHFLILNDIAVDEGLSLILQILKTNPDYWDYLYTYGLGLYKKGDYQEAHEILLKAWDLRPSYNHEHYLAIQEVEQSLANQKSEN